MFFKRSYLFYFVFLILVFYGIWTYTDRSTWEQTPDSKLKRIESFGKNLKKGNLLGIQPWMNPIDYSNEINFSKKIQSYLEEANKKGYINPKTIVVFPEYLGTWLVIAGEKTSVIRSDKLEDSMQTLILSNPIGFILNFFKAQGKDKIRDALFRMKAEKMLSIYSNTFSNMAKKWRITIVAGSILLPEPYVIEGKIQIRNGALKNASYVFLPDGRVAENSPEKIYPIEDEKSFVEASTLKNLKIIQSPAGNIGVLVCADSWYPEVYEIFKKQNVNFVVVPSYVAPDGAMSEVWKGYNGSKNPTDIRSEDVHRISEGEAWLKYALAGRILKSGATHGMNVFLRGSLWDLGSDGEIILVHRLMVRTFPKIYGASIVNLWLD
ncbi:MULTISPECIES: nitrilase-related carbon-nitrogen hydrolase [Leptospira]|uniref:nitrilase-related carbon-nitrogen hydrolase n=1 Tax=Leptospira TaxID=171 RepID=UPI00029741E7|nr:MULTISPECIES: nitrilase-related carbon-nitrogen hydrolase [Leptospira]EKR08792.1 hydrolase, carbon-nitrogen family [Leptospira kirschneri serovar Valbuzzi str. 200702274]EMK05111.1 hydrolase, carbon-nitrogen family [Leptospira kirschneri]EMK14083.1 hydrolase, carbon-nitrogen family [Leptospira kirschneri serovar Bim str. PUO 1247]EMN26300.1 hydrolase, carbon-nitrogen family [Leptospira kirschneri serovar Sokoine str. RM1]EMO69115.1 hydrolase, carbon-nitrogen family [Leptospira kirschneri st